MSEDDPDESVADRTADDNGGRDGTPNENADDADTGGATDARPAESADERDSQSEEFGFASDVDDYDADATGGTADDATDGTADRPTDNTTDAAGQSAQTAEGGTDADAPLSSLASSVGERRDRDADRPDDRLFSEESVPEIDADVVWERMDEDGPPELPDDADREVTVVDKSSYCEQCPFFSTPPDVQCGHDGTEILELTDMDHFRVVDCPKVRENERLERL